MSAPAEPTPAAAAAPPRRRRVGIVGFGSLGQFLAEKILTDAKASAAFELAFVWNRSPDKVDAFVPALPDGVKCRDLADFPKYGADVIVEVSHPDVTRAWGAAFLAHADFYCGSPTAFADPAIDAPLRAAAASGPFGVYVPAGALWGAVDIAKMADRGTIKYLAITMKKHPASLKLEGVLGEKVAALQAAGTPGESVVYEGSVRGLCPLAPNNVNTMAAAAIAAHTLGFDGVQARLVSDPSLEAHVITIDVRGAPGADGQCFRSFTERYNPAPPGAVTGLATYASFLSSLFFAGGKGAGVHLC